MKKQQPCRRGHFLVQLFDKAHAFFEYVPRETSDAVPKRLTAGCTGYMQARREERLRRLYRGRCRRGRRGTPCIEVGC